MLHLLYITIIVIQTAALAVVLHKNRTLRQENLDIISRHIDDSKFGVSELAKEIGMGKTSLIEYFDAAQ